MKQRILAWALAMLMIFSLALVSCNTEVGPKTTGSVPTSETVGSETDPATAPKTDPVTPSTTEPVTPPTTEPVTPPATEPVTPPATEPVTPPATEPVTPPATEPVTPPATEPVTPPATEPVTPPATEPVTPPATEPVTPPATEPVTPPADPTSFTHVVDQRFYQNDDKLEILLIGNSYSYYWTDELWQMLNAAGYKNVKICNVYKSGATFEQHWTWYQNNQGECEFFTVDKAISDPNDRKVVKNATLSFCLEQGNWDIISLQQSNKWYGSYDKTHSNTDPYLPHLDSMLKSRFPNAEYYWMANWAHEIGKGSIQSEQTQIKAVDVFRIVGEEYCRQYGYTLVPLGDAWQKVRHDPLFYQPGASKTGDYPLLSLHSRIYHQGSGVKGKLVHSDLSHDGDVGGGQYLNACVWFEVLTKQSCVNMPFSPSYFCSNESRFYSLTAEQRAKLQAAAHETVHP